MCKIFINKIEKKNKLENEIKQNLGSDLEELFTNKQFSDVTITAEKKEFHLHKCILISRSPAFKAMFSHDIKENQSTIKIDDIKHEVLQELFRFIYTDKVLNLEKIAYELLIAAEKYDIPALKILCQEAMSEKLDFDNAMQYLNLAILNNAEKLKAIALDFISLHLDFMIRTPEFDDLTDPKILKEIMKKHLSVP